MAAEAKEEGFAQLAALFTMVGQIEKEHEERYRALAANLKEGKVFAREEQQVWVCRNCGYTHIGKSAPLKCPAKCSLHVLYKFEGGVLVPFTKRCAKL